MHRLYTLRPKRECLRKEKPDVWDRLETYWSTPEFGKVGLAATQTATTSEDVPVSTGPYSTIYSCPNLLVK